ncbi:MAG: hypothetical protein KIT57_18120 [Blastocatellales bacterium]|nr:hypothetical protein [Blastocatellales bacterium]
MPRHFTRIAALLLVATIVCIALRQASAAQNGSLAVVSAASFAQGAPLAPNSIVAVFGQNLASDVFIPGPGPLPDTLGGVSVIFRDAGNTERAARLFFVSPGQINCVIPGDLSVGAATVSVRAGMTNIASGDLQLSAAAPAIFTASRDGAGVPAAGLIRLLETGEQVPEDPFEALPGNVFVPRPIDLSAENERVFLILFPTGVRGGAGVRVIIGGVEQEPLFAGPQGFFEGLDQVNVEIPRSLFDASAAGNTEINVRIHAPGAGESNQVILQIGRPDRPPVTVNQVNAALPLLARSEIELTGQGFSEDISKNRVNFGVEIGEIKSATPTRLTVLVPFGVRSGLIELNSDGREWRSESLPARTSISGIALDQNKQPVQGLRVCRPVTVNNELRCPESGAAASVQSEGWFVLPDATTGARVLFLMERAAGSQSGLAIPPVTFSLPVTGERDNPYPKTIDLTAASGPSGTFGNGFTGGFADAAQSAPNAGFRLSIDGFTFTAPAGATAVFPGGATSGAITLTPIRDGRTPVPFPANTFASALAQISPFGVAITPGGKLTLPNADQLPDGSQPNLFRYDFANGVFVDTGIKATVSGPEITTPEGAITETSIYFAAITRPATTIIGRVVESDGMTSVRGAIVSARGRQAISDGNGGFILTQVPASAGEIIEVTALYLRPSGRTDQASRMTEPAVVGGLTRLVENGQIVRLQLPPNGVNRRPTIAAPTYQSIYANEIREIQLTIGDLDDGQGIPTLQLSQSSFASLVNTGTNAPRLRLAPGIQDTGRVVLSLTATDAPGASTTVAILVDVKPLPTAAPLMITTDEDTPAPVTLAGSDVENRPLVFTIATQPQHGSLSGAPPNLIYTPQPDYNGSDSFTYRASNGIVSSAPATVMITINPVSEPPSEWVLRGNLQKSRGGHTGTRLADGRVLITGGITSEIPDISGIPFIKGAELYNPQTGQWAFTGDTELDHAYHTATLLEGGQFSGHVLIVGGEGRNFNPVSPQTTERFNPATGTWTRVADSLFPHIRHTATRLPNGNVLVAGGEYDSVSNKAEIYDPNANMWSEVGEMNTPRVDHTATLLPNGRVLVVGGSSANSGLNTAEIFNPATGEWTMVQSMQVARTKHTATLLSDGRVLVAGGEGQTAGNTAEIYNPVTGAWTQTPLLRFGRQLHTATLLPDGRVLLAGGVGVNLQFLRKAEIYDPEAGSWTETAEMNDSRAMFTATLLNDGSVIAAGGDVGTTTRATSEVYIPGEDESGDSPGLNGIGRNRRRR